MSIINGLIQSAHAASNNLIGTEFPVLTPVATGITITRTAQILLNVVFGIAGVLAVAYLVWAGLSYVTAGSDTEKAGKARQAIVHAVIGLIIIALAFVIVYWVLQATSRLR